VETAQALMALTGDPNQGLRYLGLPEISVEDSPLFDTGEEEEEEEPPANQPPSE
jgi:hypothetical protein